MKNTNTFGIHFILRANKIKVGKCPVYARIHVNGNRVEVSLQSQLALSEWDEGKGCAKPKTPDLKRFNSYLEEVRSKMVVAYQQLNLHEEVVTAMDVKKLFLGVDLKKEKKAEHTLLWLIKEHNRIMLPILKYGSLKNYYSTERYIKKFLEEKCKVKDIRLNDLTYSFMTGLDNFIRTVPLKEHDPCNNNGAVKHLQRFKKIMLWGESNEWVQKNPFSRYKLKLKQVERSFLTLEELKAIEKCSVPTKMLTNVRDFFVFSCYTGLPYIDMINLKPGDIVDGTDGFRWIQISRTKTDVPVSIPLLQQAESIVEKYNIWHDGVKLSTVFPKVSNHEVNRCLKIIAGICGITKNLTFHLARHTFATTVTLCNGVPIETISKMLGHTKITTTMVYAKVIKTKISADMEALQGKLNEDKSAKSLRIAH